MAILKIQPYIIDETQGFVFANVSTTGNVTANALTVNNSATISGGLGLTGNLVIGSGSSGNISGINYVFANSVITSANSTLNGLAVTTSATIGSTLSATAGIQNTPIGNATASSGQFTTVSATGNVTAAALTSNASITASTTLRAAGGIQNTPIGNATASTANLTSFTVTGISYHNGNVVTNNILPFGNANANIGSGALQYNTVFAKATSAQYADLAEIYTSDNNYDPGTVVVFGGENEITVTTISHDKRVAGVISTEPAYLMNSKAEGLPVAFTGRVPCFVRGPVQKGDLLVTSNEPGVATVLDDILYRPGCVFGKSLETVESGQMQLIEVAVGRY